MHTIKGLEMSKFLWIYNFFVRVLIIHGVHCGITELSVNQHDQLNCR